MTDLRDQLATELGDTYRIESELGGGGMSRVFVAEELALGRKVVIKVLAPKLAAEMSLERFTREMRIAAGLQEPHIVPVLAAGTVTEGPGGPRLPYYYDAVYRRRIAETAAASHAARGSLRSYRYSPRYSCCARCRARSRHHPS